MAKSCDFFETRESVNGENQTAMLHVHVICVEFEKSLRIFREYRALRILRSVEHGH